MLAFNCTSSEKDRERGINPLRQWKESSEFICAIHEIKHWEKIRSAGTKPDFVFADFWNSTLLTTPQAYKDKYAEQKIFTVLIQSEFEAVTKIVFVLKKSSLTGSLEMWWKRSSVLWYIFVSVFDMSHQAFSKGNYTDMLYYMLCVQQPKLICSQRLSQ